jgi:hypothetical protein
LRSQRSSIARPPRVRSVTNFAEATRYTVSLSGGAKIARARRMTRIVAALVLALSGAALAQGPGSGDLRPSPPAPPGHGPALPDESPALKTPQAPQTAAPADNRSREASGRCAELAGPMREQCLVEEQGGATGASAMPEPRTAPPPQNPR